jgi:hypothetical protein
MRYAEALSIELLNQRRENVLDFGGLPGQFIVLEAATQIFEAQQVCYRGARRRMPSYCGVPKA